VSAMMTLSSDSIVGMGVAYKLCRVINPFEWPCPRHRTGYGAVIARSEPPRWRCHGWDIRWYMGICHLSVAFVVHRYSLLIIAFAYLLHIPLPPGEVELTEHVCAHPLLIIYRGSRLHPRGLRVVRTRPHPSGLVEPCVVAC
jgi:hypothetical protein